MSVRAVPMLCLLVLCAGVAATAEPSEAVPRAVTVDRDHDGRVDGVRAGGRVMPVREGAVDTARRPVVRIDGRRVRPRDGAAPVLVRTAVRARGVVLTWSEPIARGASGLSLRTSSAKLRTSVTIRGANVTLRAAGDAAAVSLTGRGVRDAAGNAARPFGSRALGREAAKVKPASGGAATGSAEAAGPAPSSGSQGSPPAPAPEPAPAAPSAGGAPDPETNVPAGGGVEDPIAADAGWVTLRNPIDPRQQTALGFCQRSHWLQPWRAYLDTRPASALTQALGINLNVAPGQWTGTADLLRSAGFTRVRAEVGWDAMDPADPSKLKDVAGLAAAAKALHERGLRPLVLLNANDGQPGPVTKHTLTLTSPAAQGARTIQLASTAGVVPGKTGLVGGGRSPETLIASIAGTTATLGRPLPRPLPAGAHAAATLHFEPFGPPSTQAFERTLAGWLQYVDAVTTALHDAIGDAFDVEVWNELSFGSDFLDPSKYHDPVPAHLQGTGDTTKTILARTVQRLRQRAELAGVGIADGFASQTPFPAGATSPPGLTALSKHPYAGPRQEFGGSGDLKNLPCTPLDALGRLTDATPQYVSYFPEYYLNAIQTEHLIRDVSPITTDVYGTPHGRAANPEIWVTETNMDPGYIGQSAAQARRMQAKSALRTLVSFVSKGVSVVDFYAAGGDQFGMIEPRFFATGAAADAGLTIDALARLTGRIGRSTVSTRALTLRAIADRGTRAVWQVPGAAAPALHDREAVAAFPFQTGPRSFAVPAYVMTRDVARDLAPADYRLTFGGVDGKRATATAYDPLTGASVPARVVARGADEVTVELQLTDAPRLVELAD